MLQLIDWLIEIESIASNVYKKSSQYFSKNKNLRDFLVENANEETWHAEVMTEVRKDYTSRPNFVPAVKIDDAIDKKIRNYFKDLELAIIDKSLTESKFFDTITQAEQSEWNDVFIYVINSIEKKYFKNKLPRLQSHIENLEMFINKYSGDYNLLNNWNKVPNLWQEKILLVDDDLGVLELFESLLGKKAKIVKARNGREAVDLFKKDYFKLIISDIDMPVLNGISFFQNAKQLHSNISKRFLFVSGYISQKHQKFFQGENLEFLEKPVNISELYTKSMEILFSN